MTSSMIQQPCFAGSVSPRATAFSELCRLGKLKGASLPSIGRHSLVKWFASPSSRLRNPISGNKYSLDWASQKIRGGRSGRPFAGGARRVAVLWFRNDLRVHDNQALAMAHRESTSLLPVYCFDPREYSSAASGVNTAGPYRAQFIVDAVTDLRDSLRTLGSDLIVRIGKPEEVLLDLAKKVGASKVYCHSEVTYEEDLTEKRMATALKSEDIQLKSCWGSTLYSPEELPFKLREMPATHGEFRSAVASLPVQQPEKAPTQLKGKPLGCQGISPGDIPTLAQLGLPPLSNIPGAPKCRGGENEGLAQVSRLLSNSSGKSVQGSNFSAGFSQQVSPWLSMGCISPRRMYAEVQAKRSSVSERLVSLAHGELIWRDFFRFTAKKYASDSITRVSAQDATPALASVSPSMAMACA